MSIGHFFCVINGIDIFFLTKFLFLIKNLIVQI